MLAHAIHSGVEFHVMWDITGMAVRWNLKRTYIPESLTLLGVGYISIERF